MNTKNAQRSRPFGIAMVCVSVMTVSNSQAALISTTPDCDNGGAVVTNGALDCSGAWQGNDANQTADVLSQLAADFPTTGSWSHLETTDAGDDGVYFDSVPGTTSGVITFDNSMSGVFSIGLKASNQFSLYLFNGGVAGLSSINFTTIGTSLNPQGIPQDLSHASLYIHVPEPSSLVLFAVAGLVHGLVRRDNRRN